MNSRGQCLEYVKNNVKNNLIFENTFKEYIKNKFNKYLTKSKDDLKHYDFSLTKNHKIEYKGVYYSLIENETKAENNKNIILDVMIGRQKVLYYHYRFLRNKNLRFFIIYGFYTSNEGNITTKYKFIEITDILEDIIKTYPQINYYNNKHFLIPIKSLKDLKECNIFNL
jgi:hypothetical protein